MYALADIVNFPEGIAAEEAVGAPIILGLFGLFCLVVYVLGRVLVKDKKG
jgi:hypothetical protein